MTWLSMRTLQVPRTDAPDNLVHMPRDETAPPPILGPLYTEIMTTAQRVGRLETEVSEMEAQARKAAEFAAREIGKMRDRIAAEIAKLEEAQGRWLMITRGLGIDIQDGSPEDAP